jgi:hypothetical protein
MRPLIVGEAPSRELYACSPLYGQVGRRLAVWADLCSPEASLDEAYDALTDAFMVANLSDRVVGDWDSVQHEVTGWDAGLAAQAALRCAVLMEDRGVGQCVLLGGKVAKAFGLHDQDLYVPATVDRGYLGPLTYRRVPHPSGRCRKYNDPLHRAAASQALREAISA